MGSNLPHVVLDTVVFVQTLISGRGPAAACIERLRAGEIVLLLSSALLAEMLDVPLRFELTRRFSKLTAERVNAFVEDMVSMAVLIPTPPRAFTLPRDPKDEPLIDVAVAGNASFLVSWNERHLNYLMRRDTPEGEDFHRRYPGITIVTPLQFLATIRG